MNEPGLKSGGIPLEGGPPLRAGEKSLGVPAREAADLEVTLDARAMRVASLGELVATLAHELNQPLAAILSNAQAARRFLADGIVDPEELRAILDDIIRDDKRAGAVIHNLRAMLNKQPAVRELCCLNELVREVLELMHGELLGGGIVVQTTLAERLPRVHAARVELQQVVVNFLINAEHAMEDTPRERRRVDVRTTMEAGKVIVVVRDRGCGLPPERLNEVFDPFFTTKANGLGIGLSICRRIIENHGGQIAARNHEEGGAVFSFTLPAVAGLTEPGLLKPPPASLPGSVNPATTS